MSGSGVVFDTIAFVSIWSCEALGCMLWCCVEYDGTGKWSGIGCVV